MGRLRSLRKFLLSLLLSLCALLFLEVLASQVEQHSFRRRAEMLLAQMQSLELRKSSWEDARNRFRRWEASSKFDENCDSHKCSIKITLNEFVFGYVTQRNLFEKLDDYFRWRLKLSYDQGPFVRAEFWLLRQYMRLGGRPARVVANIGMNDGVVWNKGISVWVETFAHPTDRVAEQPFEFSLFAEAHSVSSFDDDRWDDWQLKLHPNYAIGRPSGCSVCVVGWVKFMPDTSSEDVKRLMTLNLSCLTRWQPCVTQSDIMPLAWSQYIVEQHDAQH